MHPFNPRLAGRSAILALGLNIVNGATLTDLCTISNIKSSLPANGTLVGMNVLPELTTAGVANVTSGGFPGSRMHRRQTSSTSTGTQYCNVTITYARPGKNNVVVKYAFPAPDTFKSRFYVSGGSGYSLSSANTGGLTYGAVGGVTDAGYDAFSKANDAVVLYGNGSVNWDAVKMFGYQALGEMTTLGKAITPGFYGQASDTKVFTYYEGCSDGGREGMSQVQRWPELYDGAITGAPAFRMAMQQVLHVFSSQVQVTQDYLPPPCELSQIVNATIAACDPLDGATDGIIARTDLCMLNFNLSSIIGTPYHCAATTSSSPGFGFSMQKRQFPGDSSSTTPEQNGTVTAAAVKLAQTIYDGLHNNAGQRAYLSWQIGSELSDAATTYDNATGTWALSIPFIGGEWVTKYVQLLDLDNLSTSDLTNSTYDTLVSWMQTGFDRYYDSLQTTKPDLSAFRDSGGKLLHYHGESDPSIPAASSVHYWQSVQDVMYGSSDAPAALRDWYRFFLVPGGAHCGANSLQPGPWPADNMNTMIQWVEGGVAPERLNATATKGVYAGTTVGLCEFPSRPLWGGGGTGRGNGSALVTGFECVEDAAGAATWRYEFDAFRTPVY